TRRTRPAAAAAIRLACRGMSGRAGVAASSGQSLAHSIAAADIAPIRALAEHILGTLPLASRDPTHPFLLGLSGLQGSGKTTLAMQLVVAAQARGLRAIDISLDDVYLTHAQRSALARDVH